MAEPQYDIITADVLESTLSKYSPVVYDSVTKHNALLHNLKERGHIKTTDGGKNIIEEISIPDVNTTATWMSMHADIPMDTFNVFQHAVYYYRFATVVVGIWLDEELQNAGEAAQYDIMKTRTENGVAEFGNLIAKSLWGKGGVSWTIDGIPAYITDTPTVGTIGGIKRDENKWWRNQICDVAAEICVKGDTEVSPAQLEEGMNRLWQRCEVFKDHPTSIYASNDTYNLYRQFLINKRMDTSKSKVGDAEYTSLEFMGVPVYRDPDCPANHMYFLNEDFLWLKAHSKMNFKFQKPREPYNQYMKVIPLTFYGNFTCSNMLKQGVLFTNGVIPASPAPGV
jgi:hypothetical protein